MKAKKIKSQMPAVEVVHGKAVATYDVLVSAIENLVSDARTGLKAAMNAIMLQTYWHTGEYIVEYEQHGVCVNCVGRCSRCCFIALRFRGTRRAFLSWRGRATSLSALGWVEVGEKYPELMPEKFRGYDIYSGPQRIRESPFVRVGDRYEFHVNFKDGKVFH